MNALPGGVLTSTTVVRAAEESRALDRTRKAPAALRVFRYLRGQDLLGTVIGPMQMCLSPHELVSHAAEAIARKTFMYCTVDDQDDVMSSELCFVPRDDRCDILSIHTSGPQRHHSEHRRTLVEILTHLAASVVCGKLDILDQTEIRAEKERGEYVARLEIEDSSSLSAVRRLADQALLRTAVDETRRAQTILCVSEAATNTLLHGGGRGSITLRRLENKLRFIVEDGGPGLEFINWAATRAAGRTVSMGYGFKIMLDHLDGVGLHTGPSGTTLVLDRLTD
jgi:anti-sigma regulatory factor (Ser/Thr protein kinase)